MISSKHQKIVFSFFMAFFMSGAMSLVISIFNIGIVTNIIVIWLNAWGISFIVAFPTIIIISPFVQKLVKLVIYDDSNKN